MSSLRGIGANVLNCDIVVKDFELSVLFGWVLWHINLCRLFDAKFCLYVYTFNPSFLSKYLVDKIFDKQDFICLRTINRFQFIIFFGTTLSLPRRTESHLF